MGILRDYIEGRDTGGGTSTPPELRRGNPGFSESRFPGTQEQFPAAAADARLQDVKSMAQNALKDRRSFDDNVFKEVEQAAEQGFVDEELTLGERLLQMLGGANDAVKLAIQDTTKGVATGNHENPGFEDYAGLVFGATTREEVYDKTGLDVSGSQLLSDLGWEEAHEDNWTGRIVRGIGHFAADILTDPYSWVSFGAAGVGKKVISSGVRVFADETVEKVVKTAAKMAARPKSLGAGMTVTGRRLVDGRLVDDTLEGLNKYDEMLVSNLDDITREFVEKNGEEITRLGQEVGRVPTHDDFVRMALEARIHKDVAAPAMARDWANIDSLALPHLPAYLRGGARIAVPNLPGVPLNILRKGIDIPATRGLGRKVFRNPLSFVDDKLSALPPYDGVTREMRRLWKDWKPRSDFDVPLFDPLVNGDWEPWQWSMMMSARDGLDNAVQLQGLTAWAGNVGRHLEEVADAKGYDVGEVLSSLQRRMDALAEEDLLDDAARAVGDDALTFTDFDPEFDQLLESSANQLRQIYDDFHDTMGQLDPDFVNKYVQNYTPHLPTTPGRTIINTLVEQGAGVNPDAWMASNDQGMQLLARLMAAASYPGGSIDEAMGSFRFTNRELGRVQAQQIAIGSGPFLFDDATLRSIADSGDVPVQALLGEGGSVNLGALQTTSLSAARMNELLEPAIRKVADDIGLDLPKNWDGRILSENPFENMREYGSTIADTINAWNLTNSMKAAGLLVRKSGYLNPQQTVENLRQLIGANVDEVGRGVRGVQELDVLSPRTRSLLRQQLGAASDFEIEEVRRLMTAVNNMTRGDFRNIGLGAVDETVADAAWQGMLAVSDDVTQVSRTLETPFGDAIGHVRLAWDGTDILLDARHFPGIGEDETMYLQKAINDVLDDFFTGKDGPLVGQFNWDTVEALFNTEGMTAQTADALFDYMHHKFRSIDSNVHDYLDGKWAWEASSARSLYEDWRNGVNDFISSVTARQDPGTQALSGVSRAPFLGDKTAVDKLQKLKDIGQELKSKHDYDTVAEIMGQADKYADADTIKGYVNPAQLGIGGKAVDGFAAERNAANFLRNVARNSSVLNTPGGVKAAKVALNHFMDGWRGLATLARPTFHIRNAIGISWMNSLMGVRARQYARLNQGVHAFREGLTEVLTDAGDVRPFSEMLEHALGKVPKADQAAFRAMWDEGVLSGYVSTEFRSSLEPLVDKGKWDFLRVFDPDQFFLTRWGGQVMENVEDYGRGALFLEYFDEGVEGSSKVARDMVNAVHFDYNNLTPWETRIKSWVPFFVWTRRNIPRQLNLFLENPGLISRYGHMMEAIENNFAYDENGLPIGDHFSAQTAGTDVYVNPDTPFWARIMVDPDLPIRDLSEIPEPLNWEQMRDFANGLLGPHVTTLWDINSQRDFDDVNAPAPFNTILKGLSWSGLYDTTPDGDVRVPYLARSLMETVLPFAREVVDPLTGGPTDPARQQRLGVSEDDDWLESAIKSLEFSLLRGAGVKLSTPSDVKQVAGRSRAELDQIIEKLRVHEDLAPRN